MSSNPQKPPTGSGEIDLAQFFSYLEKGFNKLGNLVGKLFNAFFWLIKKVGVFVLLCLNIVKKHFIKLILAAVAVQVLFFFLAKSVDPNYTSSMILNQNFKTGQLLYSNITRYNSLAKEGDSLALSKELGIPVENASKLIGFQAFDNMNKNSLLEEYYNYKNRIDSSAVISFDEFKEQYDLENHKFQTILVLSSSPSVYDGLASSIAKQINENKYFKEEKRKKILSIKSKLESYSSVLEKSDTLQKEYLTLLNKYYGQLEDQNPQQTTVNLNLSNSKDKVSTKEYELFEDQKQIRLAIESLKEELIEKEEICTILKDFPPAVKVENPYAEFKNLATLGVVFLLILALLVKELGLITYLNNYGTREKLLEN